MNDKPYEEPTNEFRQVKTPIKRGNGIGGPGYQERTIGYDTTIQRKWLIVNGRSYISEFRRGPDDYQGDWHALNGEYGWQWTPRHAEWRDLPTVSSPDAP